MLHQGLMLNLLHYHRKILAFLTILGVIIILVLYDKAQYQSEKIMSKHVNIIREQHLNTKEEIKNQSNNGIRVNFDEERKNGDENKEAANQLSTKPTPSPTRKLTTRPAIKTTNEVWHNVSFNQADNDDDEGKPHDPERQTTSHNPETRNTHDLGLTAIDLDHKDYQRSSIGIDKLIKSIPSPHVTAANCQKLFQGDHMELFNTMVYEDQNPKVPMADEEIITMASNCTHFKESRQYINVPLSEEEENFPIAYSIMIYKDIEQVERLLRAIYQPQNLICIHVDMKTDRLTYAAIETIVNCFDNVFLAPKRIEVEWGSWTVVEPELICMEQLLKRSKRWKYFINLTGQEFPLKTNNDLVKILTAFNGANNIEGSVERANLYRTQYVHQGYIETTELKKPFPHYVKFAKGSVHIAACRGFVEFVIKNQISIEFRDWLKNTGVPDETLFATLNYNPKLKAPGAYLGIPETNLDSNPFLARFKNWGTYPFDWPCAGQRVRQICMLSTGDLKLLADRPELFANKFMIDYHPIAYDCLEELHFNRTRATLKKERNFDVTYYQKLDIVKHHV